MGIDKADAQRQTPAHLVANHECCWPCERVRLNWLSTIHDLHTHYTAACRATGPCWFVFGCDFPRTVIERRASHATPCSSFRWLQHSSSVGKWQKDTCSAAPWDPNALNCRDPTRHICACSMVPANDGLDKFWKTTCDWLASFPRPAYLHLHCVQPRVLLLLFSQTP